MATAVYVRCIILHTKRMASYLMQSYVIVVVVIFQRGNRNGQIKSRNKSKNNFEMSVQRSRAFPICNALFYILCTILPLRHLKYQATQAHFILDLAYAYMRHRHTHAYAKNINIFSTRIPTICFNLNLKILFKSIVHYIGQTKQRPARCLHPKGKNGKYSFSVFRFIFMVRPNEKNTY